MSAIQGPAGIQWHYQLRGEGPVLLFLHGWGVDKRVWRQQVKFFSREYRVLTVDLPGHGQTTWKDLSFDEMCMDLSKVLVQIVQGKITSIGSSLGGLFCLKLYDGMPEKFNRLIFVGSLPKFAQSEDFPHGLDINQMRKLTGQLDANYPEIVDIFFRSLFTKEERQTRRYKWIQKFRKFAEKPMKKALACYLDVLEDVDLREELTRVDIPTQYINGDGDEICSPACVEDLRGLLPQARFDMFPKCGHFPFLSHPYEFNMLMDVFLKETAASCF